MAEESSPGKGSTLVIGFDAKRAFHNTTGLGNYARSLLHALYRHCPEHRYLLYTPSCGPTWANCPDGIEVRLPRALWGRGFPSVWRSYGMGREAVAEGSDVFHGLTGELPFGMGRTPRIVTVHDLIFLRHPEWFPTVDRAVYRWKTERAVREATAIVAVSQRTKEDLIEFFKVPESRIIVGYQAIDDSYFEPVREDHVSAVLGRYAVESPYVLSVGTIEERKNLVATVRAMGLGKWPAQLVVVGKKRHYFEKVIREVERHGLTRQVRFLDHVPLGDLRLLYAGARLLVYPSFFEGFGIPLAEALAAGLAVVAARGSALEEAGGPQSCYINPDDPEELAITVNEVLSSARLREQMAESGKHYAERFRSRTVAHTLRALYESVSQG